MTAKYRTASDDELFTARVQAAAERAAVRTGGEVDPEWLAGFTEGYLDALEEVDNAAGVLFNLDSVQIKRAGWLTDTVRYGRM